MEEVHIREFEMSTDIKLALWALLRAKFKQIANNNNTDFLLDDNESIEEWYTVFSTAFEAGVLGLCVCVWYRL